jgi:predicted nucleic acid-binding protein
VASVTALSDTSAWYALLSSSDTQHTTARRLFGRLASSNRTVIATNHVISETYTLLRGRLGSRVALRFLEQVRLDPFVRRVQVPANWEDEAEQLLAQYEDQRFSYVDATSFVTMRHLGVREAITFDSDFVIAGFIPVSDE